MTRAMQVARLRRRHGLSEGVASVVASLVFGDGEDAARHRWEPGTKKPPEGRRGG